MKTENFSVASPGDSVCEMGVQTELTLSISTDRVTRVPQVTGVVEEVVEGSDAKLDLAIQARQRDVVPDLPQKKNKATAIAKAPKHLRRSATRTRLSARKRSA